MIKILKKCIFLILTAAVIGIFALLIINSHVKKEGSKYIKNIDELPNADAILVLGAGVFGEDTVSPVLKDRLTTALEIYEKNKSEKFLVSGDHGQKNYDEVNAMKKFLMSNAVDDKNIFMDHAGFSTYESMYRAKEIFKIKKVIIVTQEYHLMRAVYIARKMGIEAYGVASDKRQYMYMAQYKKREILARCKDFFFVNILKPKPTYLGDTIPISGNGNVTNDKSLK